MAGIYIHVPFCYTRCSYCDFYKTTDQQFKDEYIKALCKEIDNQSSFLLKEAIETIYFGGGTPSTLTVSELNVILKKIEKYTSIRQVDELTLEVNPDDVDAAYINGLVGLGFNRLSMGIQSFYDAHLRQMNRRHNAQQARDVIQIAQQNGIDNMSIDLIYGLPYMQFDEWKTNVQLAIESNVQHISAYHLTFEKGTLYYDYLKKGKLKEVPEEASVQQFDYLVKELENAGFVNYEISNFALPGLESKHNSNYWTGQKYLGLGPSAHSFDGDKRRWNVRNVQQYIKALNEGGSYYEEELLAESDRYNELIMLGLRTSKGLSIEDVKGFSHSIVTYFNSVLNQQLQQETISIRDGWCFIRRDKKLLTDRIISDFFYIEDH